MGIELTTLDLNFTWMIVVISIAGLIYAVLLARQTMKHPTTGGDADRISNAIRAGANSYLRKQLISIGVMVAILAAILIMLPAHQPEGFPSIRFGRMLAFLMGASFSASVGYAGMNIATRANVRVAAAANKSFGQALKIAYRGGTVAGMLTDGLGLLGGIIAFIIFREWAFEVLLGFGFGGTLIALFYRVGGGIYTKAADVGADLVGKIEKGIPEDDPRNAAVVADLVGDNVGDCAGMAADIFESYEVTEVSAMILGLAAFPPAIYGFKGVLFPLMVRAIGVLSSIIGTYAVRLRGEKEGAMKAINRGYTTSATASIIGFFVLSFFYMQGLADINTGLAVVWWKFPIAIMAGIGLAVSTNFLTEHFTSVEAGPVKGMSKACQTGAATNLLEGIAVGYESSVWAIISIAVSIFVSVIIFGSLGVTAFYGVALCGIGQLTLTGNNVAMDTFGPIADNAQGLAEMSKDDYFTPQAQSVLADMDSVGNTTKAVTKGIAIASAVIAAVSLFRSYIELPLLLGGELLILDLSVPLIFIGLLIGGAVPLLFSAICIKAVGKAAAKMIREVRRQFAEIPGLWEGTADPDYERCVAISTRAAQKELLPLGILAIATPLLVGFLLSGAALGGFLGGAIIASQLLAVFMANAGGAFDNAKKSIEDGLFGGKGSDAHKAAVIGDTVGDPLKDTAGPALNPMMKVINLIALLVGPLVLQVSLIGYVAADPVAIFVFNPTALGIAIVLALTIVIAFAMWYSKRETEDIADLG
ncbi:sodium-translocating pyrophosphatase [Candidatus Borrarchaeum sp.]|uniref:sodium-translocating pyrophosphatase n=1 Tax=Candidatus Borrarchaeum sp. TaxID=2846742 RepID=UPI00257E7414|nr:sodium-translocating pyrophosphatase [Candidatus Borrarchaeum sp.]